MSLRVKIKLIHPYHMLLTSCKSRNGAYNKVQPDCQNTFLAIKTG